MTAARFLYAVARDARGEVAGVRSERNDAHGRRVIDRWAAGFASVEVRPVDRIAQRGGSSR